jgi:DNA-directed RNA polymerase alpha subunit
MRKLLYMGLDAAELPKPLVAALSAASIENIGSLACRSEHEILSIKGISKRDLSVLKKLLEGLGLTFGVWFNEDIWTDEA